MYFTTTLLRLTCTKLISIDNYNNGIKSSVTYQISQKGHASGSGAIVKHTQKENKKTKLMLER
jgi:hypothetical protein